MKVAALTIFFFCFFLILEGKNCFLGAFGVFICLPHVAITGHFLMSWQELENGFRSDSFEHFANQFVYAAFVVCVGSLDLAVGYDHADCEGAMTE